MSLEKIAEDIAERSGVEPFANELLDEWMLRVIVSLMERIEDMERPEMMH